MLHAVILKLNGFYSGFPFMHTKGMYFCNFHSLDPRYKTTLTQESKFKRRETEEKLGKKSAE